MTPPIVEKASERKLPFLDRLLYRGARGMVRLIRALPVRTVARWGHGIGLLVGCLDGRHRRVARQNLQRALGSELDARQIRRQVWRNFARIGENFACAVRTAGMSQDQVLDFMAWQGLESTHLEGQSMGGWTALRLARDHPDRVRRLVLTTSQGFALTSPSGEAQAALPGPEVRDQQVSFLQDPSRENIRKRMVGLFANPDRLPEEMVGVRQRLYGDPTINAALRAVVTEYMGGPGSAPRRHLVGEADLALIKSPTLVYWSDHNPGPPNLGERLAAAIPGARFYCAADTGHWAQFENAETHNAQVLEFLRG